MNERIKELAEQANKQEFCFDMNERIRELAEQAGLKFPSETAMSAELKIARAIEAYNWADSVLSQSRNCTKL